MAHESHYSGQFLLGVNPLMQGLEVEGNSDLLGIEMLEAPSKHQLSADHFSKSFAGYQDLLESSNTAVSAWPPLDSSSSSSPMPLLQGSKQMNMKLSLSLLNTKPASALPEFMHQEQPKPAYHHHHQKQQQQQQQLFDLKNSMYLKAARELLIECCSLEGGSSSKERLKRTSHWELEREPTASILQPSLYSMNHLELHSLKIKLFSMLEEVEKRYRKYCEQMQAIVSMLELVAGEGAADVYSSLASKAMSRHFRRLKDGILGQLKAAKKAMGEKDDDRATGTTRAETPRLRLLDKCVRQHKALQQGMAHQQLPWRPLRGLPEHSVSILRAWLFEHFLHPYPSDVDKIILARQTGLSRSQVSNWFINARVRIWKPMVEEMYLEEMKELDNNHLNHHQHINAALNPNPRPSAHGRDQKPSLPVQLLNLDSESLSSIVNGRHHGDESFHRGVVDFDFSTAYSNVAGDSLRKSSVSLTLGLQQHSGGGMSLSFSPASQHSIVFSKEHIDSGQQVDFSVLDGWHKRFPAMT